MAQHYSDTRRADDAYSLPDVETFFVRDGEMTDEDGQALERGWYYWYCFPGCLPDSEPMGPYATEAAALEDARADVADDDDDGA